MNRPSNKGLHYDTNIDGYAFEHYVDDLENYCDELESFIKYILVNIRREGLQILGDKCEGCMHKEHCKGEKSVLQEWCENMDHLLFDDRFFDQGDKWRNDKGI